MSRLLSEYPGTTMDDDLAIGALDYESAFEDPLLAEIAHAIAWALQVQTSAGSLLIEVLTSSLAARSVQSHTGGSRTDARHASRCHSRRVRAPCPVGGGGRERAQRLWVHVPLVG